MKTTFHFLAFLVLFLAASANGQVTQAWVQKYNGPANLADVALATAMDASGKCGGHRVFHECEWKR